MGVYSSVLVLVFCIALAATYRAVVKTSPIDPLPLVLPSPPRATGVYAHNKLLHGIEKIGAGQLPEPEDVAVDRHGRLYVGCADGWIKRISRDLKVENWVHVGGRPLGLVVGLHDELLVCEPGQGLLNVTEEKVELLSDEADGLKFKLADAVVAAMDGSIYFTDASHKYDMATHLFDLFETRPNGRLLKYDPATRTTSTLLKDLYFVNGVTLSWDERFLVFCETVLARCQRYWLTGEKKGTTEIFIDNLPAHPDNIKNDGKGKFYIGLVSSRSALSNFAHRNPFLKRLVVTLGVASVLTNSMQSAWVLEVTEEGNATALYGDPDGSVIRFVTTGLPVGGYLYLGNLGVDFVGRLKLPNH